MWNTRIYVGAGSAPRAQEEELSMETLLTHFPLFTVYVLARQTFSHLTQTQRPQHCQDPICRIWQDFPDFEKLRAARIDSARTIGGRVAPCQIDDAPSALLRPHAARRPHLDGGRHSSREAAAAANKGTSPTHSDPQVRTPHCTRLAIIHQQALTRTVWMCVRAVA